MGGVVIGCHGDESRLADCELMQTNETECWGVGTVCQPNGKLSVTLILTPYLQKSCLLIAIAYLVTFR